MFNSYLLKINGVIFPNKFIVPKTYDTTPNQKQDLDSYLDGNGKLNRTILPHLRTKCEFNTPPIKESKCGELRSFFGDTTTINVEYWNPKKGIYESGVFYAPDFTYTIDNLMNNDILYDKIRIALIEY